MTAASNEKERRHACRCRTMRAAPAPLLLFPFILFLSTVATADTDFDIQSVGTSAITVSATGTPARTERRQETLALNEPLLLSARLSGTERSQCQPYGRESYGEGSTQLRLREESGIRKLTINASTLARGGHYRTCDACVVNACVGIHGNDTQGSATSTSEIATTIKFHDDIDPADYLLFVTHEYEGSRATVSVVLESPDGGTRSVVSGSPMILEGVPGTSYRIRAHLESAVNNMGGCCQDQQEGTITVAIGLQRAFDLQPKERPEAPPDNAVRIDASDFRSIGVLIRRGDNGEPLPICTAALIAPSTVITAAHCVSAAQPNVSQSSPDFLQLWFLQTRDVLTGLEHSERIVATIVPSEPPFHYQALRFNYIDDLAVLVLERRKDQPVENIYRGTLPLRSLLLAKSTSIAIVAYGGSGRDSSRPWNIAREAFQVQYVDLTERTIELRSPFAFPCKSLGGAAVYAQSGKTRRLIGLVSSNDRSCEQITAVRLDAYAAWLDPRTK